MSKRIAWVETPPGPGREHPKYTGYVGNKHMFNVRHAPGYGWAAERLHPDLFSVGHTTPESAEAAMTACERALTKFLKDINVVYVDPDKRPRRTPQEMAWERLVDEIHRLEKIRDGSPNETIPVEQMVRVLRHVLRGK